MAKKEATTPRAAAIYCRISLDKRGEGLGVERQETLCRKLAKQRGWKVGEVYVDNDASAYSRKPRPAYDRMLDDIRAGKCDGVIAVDQDRLSRRLSELAELIEILQQAAAPVATTDGELDSTTSGGILRLHILGAVAENESRKKGERVAREAEQAAFAGKPGGSRWAFGWNEDRVSLRDDEADLIRDAVNAYSTAQHSVDRPALERQRHRDAPARAARMVRINGRGHPAQPTPRRPPHL